jgi:hypothetical protein
MHRFPSTKIPNPTNKQPIHAFWNKQAMLCATLIQSFAIFLKSHHDQAVLVTNNQKVIGWS